MKQIQKEQNSSNSEEIESISQEDYQSRILELIGPQKFRNCFQVIQRFIHDPRLRGIGYSNGVFQKLFLNCKFLGNHCLESKVDDQLKQVTARRKVLKRISKMSQKMKSSMFKKKINQKVQVLKEFATVKIEPLQQQSWIDQIKVKRFNKCYICKEEYVVPQSSFYHSHCQPCQKTSLYYRNLRTDLKGKVGVLTGSRTRIGYRILISLLESGAKVYATTRFPRELQRRLSADTNFTQEMHKRVVICQLDLYSQQEVTSICQQIRERQSEILFLINNAAQTIRKPTVLFSNLVTYQRENNSLLSQIQILKPKGISNQICQNLCPSLRPRIAEIDCYTQDLSKVDYQNNIIDLRKKNSWVERLQDLNIKELKQCLQCNAVAPALLIKQLFPLLQNKSFNTHVINVTAVQGIFSCFKQDKHPHTNMAKAALNMLTRTFGCQSFKKWRIVCSAVDTGWVTDQNPNSLNFNRLIVPLDQQQGAARVLAPLYTNIQQSGKLYKDYLNHEW